MILPDMSFGPTDFIKPELNYFTKFDSFPVTNGNREDMSTLHTSGPVDGNLYARVHKSSSSNRRETTSHSQHQSSHSHSQSVVNGGSRTGANQYSRDSGISSASSEYARLVI